TWRDGLTTPIDRLFALNRFNFDDAHKTLVTRAVSYSAGFINHFFRGKLTVSAPSGGKPYAIADHSAGIGFTKVKVTVANATPFEALNGTVQAIARFHRNKCYADNLSGEWRESSGSFVISCPDYRTPEEHIRLSPAQDAAFGVDESKQLEF